MLPRLRVRASLPINTKHKKSDISGLGAASVATLIKSLLAAALTLMFASSAPCDVATDGTVGPKQKLTGSSIVIPHTLGTIKGGNLLHSFESFGIGEGESATFTADGIAGLNNVLSRVTGGKVSEINGLLTSDIAGANFWFLNPAGVVFGPGAKINVPAAFHVSTADEVRFADGARFSATDPGASRLTSAPPEAFGFLGATAGEIRMEGAFLYLEDRQHASLIGGDIALRDGELGIFPGTVRLVSARGPGEVRLTPDGADVSSLANFGEIAANGFMVNTPGDGGGRLFIRAHNLALSGGSLFAASNTGLTDRLGTSIDIGLAGALDVSDSEIYSRTTDAQGGGIGIAADQVLLSGSSLMTTTTGGEGDAGAIRIRAREVDLQPDAIVSARSGGEPLARGAAGTIRIGGPTEGNQDPRPAGIVRIHGGSVVATTTTAGAAGNIEVDAETIVVDGGSTVATGLADPEEAKRDNPPSGVGGLIRLTASREIRIGGEGTELAASTADGLGGRVVLSAPAVDIADSALVTASTFGAGDAGSVAMEAERISVTDTNIFAISRGAGDAGRVRIAADNLKLASSTISTGTPIGGAGGHVEITAGTVLLDDAGIGTGFEVPRRAGDPDLPTGPAGSIEITASRSLTLKNGSSITTDAANGTPGSLTISAPTIRMADSDLTSSAFGTSRGGDIAISAETIDIAGEDHGIFAATGTKEGDAGKRATGDAGNIGIHAGKIVVTDGAQIGTQTGASGDGGDIRIAAGKLYVFDGASITAGSDGTGDAGRIAITADQVYLRNADINSQAETASGGRVEITARDLVRLENGTISTRVFGGGEDAGDIVIDPTLVYLNNGRIVAEADAGRGGDITIVADSLLRAGDSVISARSATGISGTISLRTPETDLSRDVQDVPPQLLDPASLLAERCAGRSGQPRSGLTRVERGSLDLDAPKVPRPTLFADKVPEPEAERGAAAAPSRSPAEGPVVLAAGCGR
jgi:filamentous hemagglutinin family protein